MRRPCHHHPPWGKRRFYLNCEPKPYRKKHESLCEEASPSSSTVDPPLSSIKYVFSNCISGLIRRRRKLCWISKTFLQPSTIVALAVLRGRCGKGVAYPAHWSQDGGGRGVSTYTFISAFSPIHLPYPLGDHIPDPFTCMQSLEAGFKWFSSTLKSNQNQCSGFTFILNIVISLGTP